MMVSEHDRRCRRKNVSGDKSATPQSL